MVILNEYKNIGDLHVKACPITAASSLYNYYRNYAERNQD